MSRFGSQPDDLGHAKPAHRAVLHRPPFMAGARYLPRRSCGGWEGGWVGADLATWKAPREETAKLLAGRRDSIWASASVGPCQSPRHALGRRLCRPWPAAHHLPFAMFQAVRTDGGPGAATVVALTSSLVLGAMPAWRSSQRYRQTRSFPGSTSSRARGRAPCEGGGAVPGRCRSSMYANAHAAASDAQGSDFFEALHVGLLGCWSGERGASAWALDAQLLR